MVALQLDLFGDNSEEAVNRRMIAKIDESVGNVRRGTFKRINECQVEDMRLREYCEKLERHCYALERRLNIVEQSQKKKTKSKKEDLCTILIQGLG